MKRDEAFRALAEMAADQAGLVTAAQAAAHSVDRVTQLRLCQAQLLQNVGRGVYRVAGASPPPHLESRVAWLRLDPKRPAWKRTGLGADDGVVSHRSACLVHELGDIPAPETELTVPRRRTTRELGVRLHVGRLDPEDVTIIDGIPVTTVPRTVVDLMQTRADGGHIGGVIADAERRNLVELDSLAEQISKFAPKYALAGASGDELLSALVEQAGRRLERDSVRESTGMAALTGLIEGFRLALVDSPDLKALRSVGDDPAFTEAIRRISASVTIPSTMETIQKLAFIPALAEVTRNLGSQLMVSNIQRIAASAMPSIAPIAVRPGKQPQGNRSEDKIGQ